MCTPVSSRNTLSSLDILACSGLSAQPLSRPSPDVGLRCLRLGPSVFSSELTDLQNSLIMVTYVELFAFNSNEVEKLVHRGCIRRGVNTLGKNCTEQYQLLRDIMGCYAVLRAISGTSTFKIFLHYAVLRIYYAERVQSIYQSCYPLGSRGARSQVH